MTEKKVLKFVNFMMLTTTVERDLIDQREKIVNCQMHGIRNSLRVLQSGTSMVDIEKLQLLLIIMIIMTMTMLIDDNDDDDHNDNDDDDDDDE
ncbi:hypothetical protein ANTQUA_LOCUS9792 [Anthophora quadrimaculata]